jgi:hypothetical protein
VKELREIRGKFWQFKGREAIEIWIRLEDLKIDSDGTGSF